MCYNQQIMSRAERDFYFVRVLNLIVLDRVGTYSNGSALWECCCDCGTTQVRSAASLTYQLPKRGFFPCEVCHANLECASDKQRRECRERTDAKRAAHKCPDCGLTEWPGKLFGRCPDCRKHNSQGESRGIAERIKRFGVAWEHVNRSRVLRRDKVCQHCGKPDKPNLDHILPMSLGGAHSYANTQRLCQKCNSEKRSHIELELRLAGVVDLTPFKVAKNPPGTPYTREVETHKEWLTKFKERKKALAFPRAGR